MGNIKPESRMAGVRTKVPAITACCWVDQVVEISRPKPTELSRNAIVPIKSTITLP